jgi:transcriptional regulator of acetoin/glycerol metabolism
MRPTPPPGKASIDRRRGAGEHPAAAGRRLSPRQVELIAQSHQRCLALGVSPIDRPDHARLGRPDLALARERNRRLSHHAAPVMAMLHQQIVDSDSMVVLTDATGTVLHSIGDDDFLGRAAQVALAPGANWSEAAKGTNAVGTALVEEQPVLVHADEHYLHANHFLTCSATPILDPRGNILGVLDVSGDQHSYHPHTMALVKMSARMIENRWISDDYRDGVRLHFHSRADFIGTLMEGIVAIDHGGRIVGANRGALEQLGLSGAAVRRHTLETLFGTSVSALADHFRSPLATPWATPPAGGRPFHVQARFGVPASAGRVRPTRVSPAAPVPDAEPAAGLISRPGRSEGSDGSEGPTRGAAVDRGPGLAALRCGDPRMDRVIERLQRALQCHLPLLLIGETGSGKSLLARACHAESARSHRPCVDLQCAGLSAARLEAGRPGGTHAEAWAEGLAGRLAQARGGTLILEDVGELPLATQGRLLQLLNDAQPAGPAPESLDLNLICTSPYALHERVAAGQFRADLYHRINGLSVHLPPLRERQDLAALVQALLEREPGGRRVHLAPEVMTLLARHPWPGNVRQLHSVLRSAWAMADPEPGAAPRAAVVTVTRAHLPDELVDIGAAPARPTIGELEISAIRQALAECGGNVSQASQRLGISRNTVYRRLRGT